MTDNTDKDIKMTDPQKDDKQMTDKPEKVKTPKSEKFKKNTLICRRDIKESGKDGLTVYKAGTEYKGKNTKHLLSKKAIYKAE